MSRSGYIDDCDDPLILGRCRAALNKAIRGKRGQSFLNEAIRALDGLHQQALAADTLVSADGHFCTLGAVGAARSMTMDGLDPEDIPAVSSAFNIAPALAREIVFQNDEANRVIYVERHGPPVSIFRTQELGWDTRPESVEERWQRMRRWLNSQLIEA